MICVGDIHGKTKEFQQLIANHNPKTPIIQVGDVGFGFGFIPHFPDNVKLIRGNHDSPEAAREHPNYLGDYGYWPEHKLFYIGGAWSIDYAWRKEWNKQNWPKKVWWEDEELSQPELDVAFELYKETKPEIVISHEAPASIVPYVLSKVKLDLTNSPMNNPDFKRAVENPELERYRDRDISIFDRPEKLECIKTRTSTTLQNMLDVHRPRFWVFGHYHISKIVDTGSTLFKCVAELEPFRIPGV